MAQALAIPAHGLPAGRVLSLLIEVLIAPWIVWRLSAARTLAWFALAPGAHRGRLQSGPVAAAIVSWAFVAIFVAFLNAGARRGLPLPNGGTAPLVPSVLVELIAVPWAAWLIGWRRGVRPPAALRAVRTGPAWLVRLLAWSVPWGVAVAVSQSLH